MDDTLEIPAFLKRQPLETIMTPTQQKKPRQQVELPTSIDDGAGHVILSGLSLAELADWQKSWKQKMADVPRIELELRAINAAIRSKAR
jgi:hypothetical protein